MLHVSVKDKQGGLSLIELLVTLLISSFLVLSLVELFAGNIRTARVTQSLGISAEAGGLATLIVSRYLRYAGYKNYFRAPQQGDGEISKVVVAESENNSGPGALFDQITIEYEAPESLQGDDFRTGGGLMVEPGVTVRETFFVEDNVLSCLSTSTGLGSNTVNLAGDVLMFQVEYGIADSIEELIVKRYVNADDLPVQTSADDLVKVIRFQLLVNSGQPLAMEDVKTYSLYDADFMVNANATYRVYGTTVVLNNAPGRIIR